MKRKYFFNYRIFIWVLILLAIILAGGMLIVAFTYNLQQKTEKQIELTRHQIAIAKELEVELFGLRNFTFIYIDDKSSEWIDSISSRKINFIILLERARNVAKSQEESSIIQQISGLFSNFELNFNSSILLARQGNNAQANALLTHSAKDLLGTIHQKSRQYISINQKVNEQHQSDLTRTTRIIFNVMIALGLGGVLVGLFLGWMISKLLFVPIKQLMVNIRDAAAGTVLERVNVSEGDEFDELSTRIKELVDRINKTQEDLSKNKQLLQYTNKFAVLGKVAPTIAHEIRNPLTAIKMLIYSMREGNQDQAAHLKDIEIILSEVDRMEGFIKNFLKFAKPADPEFSRINPNEVIADVIQLLKSRFKEKSLNVEFNQYGSNALVMADAGQLKQLFINLLINALEAVSKNGDIKIFTVLIPTNQNNEGEFYRISFEDSGPGIPDNVMKSLFEPFVKGNEQGVGLGLSISQYIATMHHGWIEAENKPNGSGAVFHVFLPAVL